MSAKKKPTDGTDHEGAWVPPSQRWMFEAVRDQLPATSKGGRYQEIVVWSGLTGVMIAIGSNPRHPAIFLVLAVCYGFALFWLARSVDQLLGRPVWHWYRYMMAGNGRHEDLYARQLSAVRWNIAVGQYQLAYVVALLALLPAHSLIERRPSLILVWLGALGAVVMIGKIAGNVAFDRTFVVRWPAHAEVERALEEEERRADEPADGKLRQDPTLDQLEVLRSIASTAASVDQQLIRLGLRPTLLPPSRDGKARKADEETARRAVEANAGLASVLRHLVRIGTIRFDGARLYVTTVGLEHLALPATAFMARVPLEIHAMLADAHLRLAAGDLAGCANYCGRALERFLKLLVRDFVPAERVNQVTNYLKLGQLDDLALGDLTKLAGIILADAPAPAAPAAAAQDAETAATEPQDVATARAPQATSTVGEGRERKPRNEAHEQEILLNKKGRDRKLRSQLQTTRDALLEMLVVAARLRNGLTHDKELRPLGQVPLREAIERMNKAYSLMQLARAVVSTYYEVSRRPTDPRPSVAVATQPSVPKTGMPEAGT